ncbi:MAG: Uma2 family endonuclease [Verrucomicrobiales bacterium]|jgi:Uma2 family endonuclease
MEEYIANGALLGYLIDPSTESVHVYCPDHAPETLINPDRLLGDPEMPGLMIDLTKILK